MCAGVPEQLPWAGGPVPGVGLADGGPPRQRGALLLPPGPGLSSRQRAASHPQPRTRHIQVSHHHM